MKKLKKITAAAASFAMLFAILFTAVSCSDGGSSSPQNQTNPDSEQDENELYDDSALSSATLWVVGDSTVCDYGDYVKNSSASITDSTYFYPRFGYGMQLDSFLSSKITVKNLALSGRSSKSFLTEENYITLKNGIKAGDFLIVGFGHNDQKSDDAERFADAETSTDTEGSFKYNLYNYYAKIALDAGATPILCSPIVRLNKNSDFTGSYGHITSTGDYGKAVIELGEEKEIQTVDLTSLTKDIYTALGYEEAIYFHAISSGKSETEPNLESVDGTHVNVYGAKKVAWLIAKTIKDSECSLAPYVKTIKEPAKDTTLIKNPNFTYVAYTALDWTSYSPIERFKTKSSGWYGTAFGDIGGDPTTDASGYYAKEDTAGTFYVGTAKKKGKIQTSADGIALCFKQIPVSENFTATVKATVSTDTTLTAADLATGGFGFMLRDDCYVPTKDASVGKANYVAAGLYANSASETIINFSRESTVLAKTANTVSSMYAAGSTATFTITRTGQVVKVTAIYLENTYETTYTDFDFTAIDNGYMYLGMFATRGTVVEFTDLSYEKTGESLGA